MWYVRDVLYIVLYQSCGIMRSVGLFAYNYVYITLSKVFVAVL